MIAGAVCVTNGNEKIYKMFKNHDEILAYDLDQTELMGQEVKLLLSDVERGQQISQAGINKANELFSAKNYVDNILGIIHRIDLN